MKAQYWTAIGAMAFPLGVTLIILAILLVDRDTENYWVTGLTITGYVSIIVGFVCIIAGWAYTIKEGKEEKKQRQVEAKERQRELQLHLIVLTQISQGRKVNIRQLFRMLNSWEDDKKQYKKWVEENPELVEELKELHRECEAWRNELRKDSQNPYAPCL